MFFKLYGYCKFVTNKLNSCIYNMLSGDMIKINQEYAQILQRAEEGEKVSEEDKLILDEIRKMGLGDYYENNVYVEEFRLGPTKKMDSLIDSNNKLEKAYIQLNGECNLNCEFCNTDIHPLRKTGCKKWEIEKSKFMSNEMWENIFLQLRYLGCNYLIFIGGEPLLNFNYLKDIVSISEKISKFNLILYTNCSILNNEILKFIKKKGIIIHTQITDLENKSIIENIQILKNNGIKVICSILVNRRNENQINDIYVFLRDLKVTIQFDYIYPNPNNEFYSKKYIEEVYSKEKYFPKVTKDTLYIMKRYNNCLYNQIVIDSTGDVFSCPMLRSIKLGNIKEKPLNNIIDTKTYKELIAINKESCEGCSECSYSLNCFDCRAIEYAATGNIKGVKYCNKLR